MSKVWTVGEIRTLARQTVEGRQQTLSARGAYFKAIVQTAQAEIKPRTTPGEQRTAVRIVHRRFYPEIQKAIATDEIIAAAGFAKKDVALERNRRLNFARSAHGTIQRWLRAEGHDLTKLDPEKVTKTQLQRELPPTRKHALTPERVHARAGRLIGGLVTYTKELAKVDAKQAAMVITQAISQLEKLLGAAVVGKKNWPTDTQVIRRDRFKKAA